MKHLGDITKINGASVPPVNVVIGGSPCQDLSVAGRRKGLKGERSGLFMEQIRIIKEMRAEDIKRGRKAVDIKPRYMVWENVPGAFSSNKGQDFKSVLEETIGVVEEVKPDIPIPEGGWHYSGCIVGDGFSVAWRVFDAQFWGVPQRRRRIALVADFGGTTAPEILFERESVSGDITQSGTAWKEFTRIVAQRFNSADRAERVNDFDTVPLNTMVCTRQTAETKTCLGVGEPNDPQFTISTGQQHAVAYSFDSLSSNSMKSNNPNSGCRKVDVAKTLDTTIPDPSKNQGGICILNNQGGSVMDVKENADVSPTLRAETHGHTPTVYVDRPAVAVFENHGQDSRFNGPVDVSQTVSATFGMGGNNTPFVVNDKPAVGFKYKAESKSGSVGYEKEKSPTLSAMTHDASVIAPTGYSQAAYDKFNADDKTATLKAQGGSYGGGSETLIVDYQKTIGSLCAADQKGINNQYVSQDKVVIETPDEQTAYALRMRSGCNGGGKGALIQTEKSGTLATGNDQTIFQPALALASKQQSMNLSENTANPLLANDYKEPQAVRMATQQGGAEIRTDDKTPTLTAAAGMSGNNQPVYTNAEYTVRRLTPLECERLQGFPDGWTDIGEYIDTNGKKRKTSDSARYKALGNSIALPPWAWVLERISKHCGDNKTMASLFDGIGGFPLIWETLNGEGTCLWASEIEEFPIAVTKFHFKE